MNFQVAAMCLLAAHELLITHVTAVHVTHKLLFEPCDKLLFEPCDKLLIELLL